MPRSRIILLLIAASFLVAGVGEPFTARPGEPYSVAGVVHMLVFAVLCYMWYRADARSRGIPEGGGSAVFVAMLPPIGLPVYFFRTRTFRRALLSIAKTLVFFAFAIALSAFGAYIGQILQSQ
jgi:hypothetical protein